MLNSGQTLMFIFFKDQMGLYAVLDILGTKALRNAHVTIF